MYPGLRPYPSLMRVGSSLFSDEAQFKLEFSTGPPSSLGSATLFQVPTRTNERRSNTPQNTAQPGHREYEYGRKERKKEKYISRSPSVSFGCRLVSSLSLHLPCDPVSLFSSFPPLACVNPTSGSVLLRQPQEQEAHAPPLAHPKQADQTTQTRCHKVKEAAGS